MTCEMKQQTDPEDAPTSTARGSAERSVIALGVSAALLTLGMASEASVPAAGQKLIGNGVNARLAAIRDRLQDPQAARGLAERLGVPEHRDRLAFANFNNWNNGWNNQGFNNY